MKKKLLFFTFCCFQMVVMAQNDPLSKRVWWNKQTHHFSLPVRQDKSMMNIMQRLDSVHSVSPGISGAPVPYVEVYQYDANQRSTGYYSLGWNDLTLTMDSSYQEMYVYDANDRVQQITTRSNNGAGFDYFSRSTRTYDSAGNLTLQVDELWETASTSWVQNQQVLFTYNGQNELTQQLTQIWDAGLQQYVDMSRLTNVYGPFGITHQLNEYFNASMGIWTNSSQTIYTYDTSGLLTTEDYQYYDESLGSWVPSNLTTYTYNSSNQVESTLSSYYDAVTSTYTPSDQTNSLYDAAGNLVQEISVDPNDPLNPLYRQNFLFDNAYSFSDLILPFYLVEDVPDFFTHKLLNLNSETWDGTQWVQETNADLFYSSQTVNVVPEMLSQDVILYPNPAVSLLTIRTNAVNTPAILVDAHGRCIQRQNLTGVAQVDISTLTPGVYHWIINGKSYTFVK